MRQRRRRDWPVRVYQYGVRVPQLPTFAALPEALQTEAFALRDLWNRLVELFEQRQHAYQAALTAVPAIAEQEARLAAVLRQRAEALAARNSARQRLRKKTAPELEAVNNVLAQTRLALQDAYARLKEAKATARAQTKEATQKITADFGVALRAAARACPAYWCNTDFVVNSFQTALARALKEGTTVRRKLGVPRDLHFRHRFTAGGLPVEKLFTENSRTWLTPPGTQEAGQPRPPRSTGMFAVAGEKIPFEVRLHRPVPPGSFVKSVALIGRQQVRPGTRQVRSGEYRPFLARWEWSLHVSVEIPPAEQTLKADPVAALDVGYRLRADGQLRIGYVVDSTDQEEELLLPQRILRSWRYVRALQTAADTVLDETKAALSTLPHQALPEAAKTALQSLPLVRAGGLRKLLRMVEGTETAHRTILYRWADRETRLLREAAGVRQRYLAARRHLYREWAARLTWTYRKIVIEHLDLKQMTEREKTPELETADQYRFLAGLSFLLRYLQEAGAKNGSEIIAVEAAWTTLTCWECGALADRSGSLHLTCANGHVFDQDRNAAQNLLARAGGATPPGAVAPRGDTNNAEPRALPRAKNPGE